jgi:hypothetical protein
LKANPSISGEIEDIKRRYKYFEAMMISRLIQISLPDHAIPL